MDAAAIAAARPEPPPPPSANSQGAALARARARMKATGQWHPRQSMGRRWPIGCVALEVTQRCNLDCTLCYLSDHSEAVHDLPLAAVFDRIDMIRDHYGPDTDVQVTGGDPTLRDHAELAAIVARITARGMRASLFTNGIKASRDLLRTLRAAGLVDVAFHVDLTQERKGYPTEASLNALRAEYVERARGLGLSVLFNTTVFDGNIAEIPEVVAFFVRHADGVRLASFQLQAGTGRGTLGAAREVIDIPRMAALIAHGAGAPVNLETPLAGHSECNRYAMTLVANGRVHDMYAEDAAVATLLQATAGLPLDRNRPWHATASVLRGLARQPRAALALLPWAGRRLRALAPDLWAARGRAHKLSFFLHNFMDAEALVCARIEACIFMVATAEGPISMCLHNAKRDDFILKPLRLPDEGWWSPVTGAGVAAPQQAPAAPVLTPRNARGRRRLEIRHARRPATAP